MLQLANHSEFRTVNVAIEPGYANSMKYLAKAMDLMPNLHTIQIVCEGYYHQTRCGRRPRPRVISIDQFQKAFGRHVYPSVRRIVLPIQAQGMLASLPAAVDAYINSLDKYRLSDFIRGLATNCPVESLGWQVGYGVPTGGMCMLFIVVLISCKVQ